MENRRKDAFILSNNLVYHESFEAKADASLAERITALLLNIGKKVMFDESIVDEEPLTDGLKLLGFEIDENTYFLFPFEVTEELYFGAMMCVNEILDRLHEIDYDDDEEVE